jgi:hypothetical protein
MYWTGPFSFNDGAVVAIFQYRIELMLTPVGSPGPTLGPSSQFPWCALLATFLYLAELRLIPVGGPWTMHGS